MIRARMRPWAGAVAGAIRLALAPADATMNRLYSWRYNPLYHSGALTAALLVIVLVTGIYLLFFYRIGTPYDSVAAITNQLWLGRWIRSFHRYASDAAVVAALIHALRFYAQGRTWGPRALAWISGVLLLFVVFVCGWTGYVMVWDVQGIVLAREGARLLDALPIFAEPIARLFAGEVALPSAFFFLNLFLHVALPVGIGILLWIHVARVARPSILPPRRLMWAVGILVLAVSIVWPVGMAAEADFFKTAVPAAFDMFFTFWLPLTVSAPAGVVWAFGSLMAIAVLAVPYWSRPGATDRPGASVVDEHLCQSCKQCYIDCPYEAIAMVTRPEDGKLVARVDPTLCVSCGICAGSCAPMGVGPPGRTGRDQLNNIRRFISAQPTAPEVVLVACTRGSGGITQDDAANAGAAILPVDCVGSLHSSAVEFLIRAGVGGVLVAACPGRDCWNREGVKWLYERLYHDREAELQARVDRRRVRVIHAGEREPLVVLAGLARFRQTLRALGPADGEGNIEIDTACDPGKVFVK